MKRATGARPRAAARRPAGRRSPCARCPRASRGRRPSRPAPRGCAARAAGRARAARCRRTSRRRATSASSAPSTSRRTALKPHWASEKRARSVGVQEAVVGARDELALGAAHDARAVRQPRADREVGVPGQQRRDEREQRAQVRREVDVHVADDPRAARRPGGAQRAAAALALQREHVDAGQRRRRAARAIAGVASVRALSAMTIRHEKGKRRQVAVQAADAALERGLLVVHGDHDVDLGGGCGARPRVAEEGGGGGRG